MSRPRVYDQRTMITARLDDDLVARIDRIAEAADMSRTALISAMLSYCADEVESGKVEILRLEPVLSSK